MQGSGGDSNLRTSRLRRTWMITPIHDEYKLDKATRCAVDVIVLDLEDAVHPSRKAEARQRVVELLRTTDWRGKDIVVRVNPMSSAEAENDLRLVAPEGPDAIILAKLDTADELREASRLVAATESDTGKPVRLWGMVESARGLFNIREIVVADPRLEAVIYGPGDSSVELGLNTRRFTVAGEEGLRDEILYAQSSVVAACRANDLSPITALPTITRDDAGAFGEAQRLFRLGFDTIHAFTPRMVDQVHRAFEPSAEDVDWARRVLRVEEDKGLEAATFDVVDGALVDGPFYRGARRILERVRAIEEADRRHQAMLDRLPAGVSGPSPS